MSYAQSRQAAQSPETRQDTASSGHPAYASGPAVTLADVVRRCRWIAADLQASDFALCLAGPSSESGRLVACFDSDYPGTMSAARLLGGGIGEHLMRHVRQSTAPCWWTEDAAEAAFASLAWASRIEPLAQSGRGIAFPVYTARGQAGLFIFGGPDLTPDAKTLHEVHTRCFSLFEAVARINPARAGKLPSMSRREVECLKLTSRGYTSEEIAKLLKLSVHTTNQYLTQTTQKLNAVNRMHAVAKALRLGLID